jgi:hypothetical protein
MELLRDLYAYLRDRRRWWLLPILVVLLYVAALLVGEAVASLAPFVYSLY